MFHRQESKEEKRVPIHVDINRSIEIGGQLQDFFKKKRIEPMDALLSMMILIEAIKRHLKLLPEDYNRLLEELEKVK
jgi:hypothetical protein